MLSRILAPFILLCLGAVAAAEPPAHPLKPLLWKVEGGELKKPSWLFGTIHLGRKPVATLHPTATKALDASDTVWTEIPMDPGTQMGMAIHLIRKDGKTLSDSIGPELAQQLTVELQTINPQLTPQILDTLKTWAIAVTVPMLKDQMEGNVALDSLIWKRASTAGKLTKSLEKVTDQLGIFDQLTEEEQVMLLAETLKYQREKRAENKDPITELIEAYTSGEPDRVEALVNAQFKEMLEGESRELGIKLKKRVFDDRNDSMTVTIHEALSAEPAKTHFFAVGVGHYVGAGSITEQLRKKGYTVTLFQP